MQTTFRGSVKSKNKTRSFNAADEPPTKTVTDAKTVTNEKIKLI